MKHVSTALIYILTFASTVWSFVVHERRHLHPRHWHDQQPLHGETVVPVRIGLTQSNLELAEEILRNVSDPLSPQYGEYLSGEEVKRLFSPSEERLNAVRTWLEDAGLASYRIKQSPNRLWLQFNASSDELGSLLRTRYYTYQDRSTGDRHVAAREYSVPSNVTEHIDYIVPGVKPLTARRRPSAAAGMDREEHDLEKLGFPWHNIETNISMCSTVVTPACVRALYNVPKGSKAAKGNELGIVAQLDAYSQEDFENYTSIVAPEVPADTRPAVKSINGGVAPVPAAEAGIESNLDLMTAAPIIWPQKATIFQVDDPAYQADYSYPGFLNNFLDAIDDSYCEGHDSSLDPQYPHEKANGYRGPKNCGNHKPTNVITISYASSEDHLPPSYQTRQCYEWLKLGLQGITVIAASGDAGVQSDMDEHEGCLNGNKSFSPQFPASCPFVTTVGATALPKGAAPVAGSEVASFNFASGGGFSNIFSRPHWQDRLVESYFNKHDPKYQWYRSNGSSIEATHTGVYNRLGRAYPDVAAIGQALPIVLKGEIQMEHGTSASAPYFASIISLINEERLAANMSTVGFINPVLYANPQVFNDVTVGQNKGCGTDGFHAVEGWDPVTGLGTPNYEKLLDLFMKQF